MYLQNITNPDFDISTKVKLIGTVIGFTIGIVTIILNVIAIMAICRIDKSLPVNIRLVCCLVASDLLVSVVVILQTSIRCIFHSVGRDIFANVTTIDGPTLDVTLPSYYPCFALILHVLRYTAYNGTLLSLTALAIDLYIAIIYPLNYDTLMPPDRVNIIMGAILVLALLLGSCVLYVPLINEGPTPPSLSGADYCFVRWHQQMKSSFATFGVILLAIVVVTIVYITVFSAIRNFLRRQQYRYELAATAPSSTSSSSVLEPTHGYYSRDANKMELKRNRRGLTTTLVLLLVFLFCFLPSFLEEIYLMTATVHKIHEYKYVISFTELLLNLPLICSALNPLLYSYRLNDIKMSCQRLFCCCFRDRSKTNDLQWVAGRERPHHNVQVYRNFNRKQPKNMNSPTNPNNITPWGQRIVNATGICIDKIRKFSSTHSNIKWRCRSSVFTSAGVHRSESAIHFNNRHTLLQDEESNNKIYFTAPGKLPINSSRFISAPKMVLCTWQLANRSLQESWLTEDNFPSTSKPEEDLPRSERSHKFSNYSSTDGGHSGSIDSANTNSTSFSNSFHHQRSKSIDNSSLHLSSSEKKRCKFEEGILENE